MTDFRRLPVPFHDYLGLRVVKTGSPSRLELDLGDHVRGAVAPLHGGVLASLIDIACGAATSGRYDPRLTVPVSTDLTVRFISQPNRSPLVAEAFVVHSGRTSTLVECVVTDGDDRQVGRGSGAYRLINGFHEHARSSKQTQSDSDSTVGIS